MSRKEKKNGSNCGQDSLSGLNGSAYWLDICASLEVLECLGKFSVLDAHVVGLIEMPQRPQEYGRKQ